MLLPTGLGDKKVQRLWETFHEPFLRKKDAADQPRADLPASYSMSSGMSSESRERRTLILCSEDTDHSSFCVQAT